MVEFSDNNDGGGGSCRQQQQWRRKLWTTVATQKLQMIVATTKEAMDDSSGSNGSERLGGASLKRVAWSRLEVLRPHHASPRLLGEHLGLFKPLVLEM
ncbi:hypothetical protein GW17_00006340 [Ensete ventricosum]|nr:hypothetical protein GW17_00006340 [Ensete ventricosum]